MALFNLETGEMEHRQWEDINLMGNCGEVARITQEVTGGSVKVIRTTGEEPRLYYKKENGEKQLIADGYAEANHAYTVDEKGKVWDPTLEIWGTLEEKTYIQGFVKEKNSNIP